MVGIYNIQCSGAIVFLDKNEQVLSLRCPYSPRQLQPFKNKDEIAHQLYQPKVRFKPNIYYHDSKITK